MDYEEFIDRIGQRTGLDEEAALRVVQATFTTLSDRLSGGAASNLGSELPERVKRFLAEEARGEIFDMDEFRRRLAERAGSDEETAIEHAQVVLDVVREAVDTKVVDRTADQLPDDYRELFDRVEISPSAGPDARGA